MVVQECITLIAADCSPLAKAISTALGTLLECSVKTWPSGGLEVEKLDAFYSAKEFWLTPEAERCSILKFGHQKELEARNINTWKWFLGHHYPCATIRVLPPHATLPGILEARKVCRCDFELSMLGALFHDFKDPGLWDNRKVCRKAAAWLASLNEDTLKPFRFIMDESHWRNWASRQDFRQSRAKIFVCCDVQVTLENDDRPAAFWRHLGSAYCDGASGGSPEGLYLEATKEWEP